MLSRSFGVKEVIKGRFGATVEPKSNGAAEQRVRRLAR